jgi:putative iron-regulated protein
MRYRLTCLLAVVLGFAAGMTPPARAATEKQVVDTYANIAQAGYEDSLAAARVLRERVGDLVAKPTETTLKAARNAWIAARVPYQQTEVYRFGNKIVDDWEGKVNAWPLDEGLIDYVDGGAYGWRATIKVRLQRQSG